MREMKKTCLRHCFSTLNHNLAYCYNRRVIRMAVATREEWIQRGSAELR